MKQLGTPGFVRRALLIALSLVFGIATGQALSVDEAQWLLDHAGLGASTAEVNLLLPLSKDQAVDRLIQKAKAPPEVTKVSWRLDPLYPNLSAEDKVKTSSNPAFAEAQARDRRKFEKERFLAFTNVWMDELCLSEAPLRERLTLFWHNHFTSSIEVVNSAPAMVRQHELLRRSALGNFRTLLRDITNDPAMMVYLDTRTNRKAKPNENYARELFELFSLGEGHYTEADIKEAARALSGMNFDNESGALLIDSRTHDEGVKTIFGQKSNWQWHDLIDLILSQPAAAEYIAGKLWFEFVGDEPNPETIKSLSKTFKDNHWDLEPLIRTILLSKEFWDRTGPQRIKSPAEFVVASERAYHLGLSSDRLTAMLRRLGQPLGDPLSVKGWPVGTDWITAEALTMRRTFSNEMIRSLRKKVGDAAKTAPKDQVQAMNANLKVAESALGSDAWQFK